VIGKIIDPPEPDKGFILRRVIRSKSTRALFSLVIGAAVAFSFSNHFLQFWHQSHEDKLKLLLSLSFVFGVVVYAILNLKFWQTIDFAFSGYGIAGCALALIVGFAISAFPKVTPLPRGWHNVEITATGENNSHAADHEVWLLRLRHGSQLLPFSDCETHGNWQPNLNRLKGMFSNGETSAVIKCRFYGDPFEEVKLSVYTQPDGGKVLLKSDGVVQEVDLYASSISREEITLPLTSPLIWKFIIYSIDSLTFGVIFLLLKVMIGKMVLERSNDQTGSPFGRLKSELLVLCLIVVTSLVMVYPLWSIIQRDEESFRLAILSTVLQGRAILAGYYPFWTSTLGFGMPQPFFYNFNYHPLFLLLATHTGFTIVLIYLLHLILAAYGIWRLSLQFQIKKTIALICVLSYLFASPTLLYLYDNFWISDFIGWSAMPFLTLFCIKLLSANTKKEASFYALLLGTAIGLTGLSCHITIFFMDLFLIVLIILANGRYSLRYWKEILLSVGIILLICSSKIYFTFQEYLSFAPNLIPPRYPSPFGLKEIWGLFFYPIHGNSPFLNFVNLEVSARVISYGPVFVIAGLLFAPFWSKRNQSKISLVIPFAAFSLLYIFRPTIIYNFVNAPIGFSDMLVLMGILAAGAGLNWLAQKSESSRFVVKTAIAVQVVFLLYGFIPYWQQAMALNNNPQDQNVLANVLKRTNLISKVQKAAAPGESRIILSKEVEEASARNNLMTLGLSTNSLAYHNIRVINGFFQGISYNAFCLDTAKTIGAISSAGACPIQNEALLDITGVKFALKYMDEKFLDDFTFREVVGKTPFNTIGLFENPNAWEEATYMDNRILSLDLCATTTNCGPDLFSRDLTPVLQLRQIHPNPILIVHRFGTITLNLVPENAENVVMVSEYFKPGWKASAYGSFGKKELVVSPVIKTFIGLQVPPNTTSIRLVYFPIDRVIFEFISMVALFLFIILTVIKGRRLFFNYHSH
jgi:hypothetical protein